MPCSWAPSEREQRQKVELDKGEVSRLKRFMSMGAGVTAGITIWNLAGFALFIAGWVMFAKIDKLPGVSSKVRSTALALSIVATLVGPFLWPLHIGTIVLAVNALRV